MSAPLLSGWKARPTSSRLQLIGPRDGVLAGVSQGELVEFLAAGGRVFAGDAGLAELVAVEADCPRDGFDRQVAERIGAEAVGHLGLDFVGQLAAAEELRGE